MSKYSVTVGRKNSGRNLWQNTTLNTFCIVGFFGRHVKKVALFSDYKTTSLLQPLCQWAQKFRPPAIQTFGLWEAANQKEVGLKQLRIKKKGKNIKWNTVKWINADLKLTNVQL